MQAQQEFGPTILILSPLNINVDGQLKAEIEVSDRRIKDEAKQRLDLERPFSKAMKSEPENIKIMEKKTGLFSKKIDFYSSMSYILSEYLQFKMLERFPALLIYPDHQVSAGDTTELQTIADKQHMRFVLNPQEMNLNIVDEKKVSKIRIQLYDAAQHAIILDKFYEGNDKNPGGDWNCDIGSVDCMLNTALASSIKDVFDAMFPKKAPAKKK